MARPSVASIADRGIGPSTVFAPADAPFSTMSSFLLDGFLRRDRKKLHLVLGYHSAPGRVAAARFAGIKPDLEAVNGVVHGIDALLWRREASVGLAAS